ncbi:MAG: T9SS type A sorting domain-containing protein [Bacteroidota bacterium]
MKAFYTLGFYIFLFNIVNGQVQIGQDLVGFLDDDNFGYSVSMSDNGERVAIGAPEDFWQTKAGYVQVFEKKETEWIQLGSNITGELPFLNAGGSVAISGDGNRLILGAFQTGVPNKSGEVRVYEYDGNDWIQLGQGLGEIEASEYVGVKVAISNTGDVIAYTTSEILAADKYSGYVDVYELIDDQWVKRGDTFNTQKNYDYYGWAMDLSADGSRIAISASQDLLPSTAPSEAFVHILEYDGERWNQLGDHISASDSNDQDIYGDHISFSGDGSRIIIASSTIGIEIITEIETYDFIDDKWKRVGENLILNLLLDELSISKDGNHFIIGNKIGESGEGDITKFRRVENEWEGQGEIVQGDQEQDFFGRSVDISNDGSKVVVGAHVNDGLRRGYARVYDFNIMTSTEDVEENSFLVYPNPARDQLVFKIPNGTLEYIRVFDMHGKVKLKKRLPPNGSLDISDLTEGMYFIETGIDGKRYTARFMKM